MTKKLVCLLLAAFLLVSLIALFAACRNADAQEPATRSSTLLPEGTEAAEPNAADVFSPEAATENTEE